MTEAQADEKSEVEASRVMELFMEQLDVDEEIATILIQEGFTSIEEVAYVPESEMVEIEEFDAEVVQELQSRARDVLLTREIAKEEGLGDGQPAADLYDVEGMDEGLANLLAKRGILCREDLAEQAVDELLEVTDLDEKQAGALIMSARAIWFEDEAEI